MNDFSTRLSCFGHVVAEDNKKGKIYYERNEQLKLKKVFRRTVSKVVQKL